MGNYEQYLIDEVVPFVDENFRTLARARHRGVAGKSSGGFGAFWHGMQHPEVFGAVACHSGDMFLCARSLRRTFEEPVIDQRFGLAPLVGGGEWRLGGGPGCPGCGRPYARIAPALTPAQATVVPVRLPKRTAPALCLILTFASTLAPIAPLVSAHDQIVRVRCIAGARPLYTLEPDTVVVAAGVDRILFQSPSAEEVEPCGIEYMAPYYEFVVSTYPFDWVEIWYVGATSHPFGPFCSPGMRTYTMGLRGSHGDMRGSFGPYVIHVTSSGSEASSGVDRESIGVFADPQASSCVLPTAPGPQSAFVCVQSLPGSPGFLADAEFRVTGFPSQWPIQVIRMPQVSYAAGDLLGDGVRAKIGDCSRPAPLVATLYRIDYEVITPFTNAVVRVEPARIGPSSHATLLYCKDGSRSEICPAASLGYLGGVSAPCILAVHSRSWGHVKQLYRDASRR